MANELEEQKKETPILSQKTYENGWTPDYNEGTPKVNARNAKWEEAMDQRSREWEEKHAQDKAKTREEYAKNGIDYPTYAPPGSKESDLMQKIGGINMLGRAAEQGQKAQDAIENVDIPRYKGITFKDLMNDPRFEGKRDALLANAIGTAGANALLGFSKKDSQYNSRLGEYNNAQMANYANMQAEKDQRALNANLDALDAANAQKIAMEASLADTMANTYIERYKATEDAKTKQEVLKEMLDNSDALFKDIGDDDEKIINLATYMGLLSGDFSLSARLIQKYAPQFLEKFDSFMNKMTKGQWGHTVGGDNPPDDQPAWVKNYTTDSNGNIVTYGGNTLTPDELVDDTNNKKYMSFNAGGGKTIVLKKGEVAFNLQNQDKLLDALMESPNLDDDQRIELYKFAMDVPLSLEDISKVKKAIADKKKTKEAKLKQEEEEKKRVENQLKDLQNLRDSYKSLGKLTPEELDKELDKYNNVTIVDPSAQGIYNDLRKDAKNGKANGEINLTLNTTNPKVSTQDKIDNLERIRNNYAKWLNDETSTRIEDNLVVLKYNRDYKEPMAKGTRNFIQDNHVGEGIRRWIDDDGNYVFQDTYANSPTTQKVSKMTLNDDQMKWNLKNAITLSSLEYLATLVPGTEIDKIKSAFKDTGCYKYLKALYNDKAFANAVKTDKGWEIGYKDFRKNFEELEE